MIKYMAVAPDGRVDSIYEIDDSLIPLPEGLEGPPAPGESPPVVDGFQVIKVTSTLFDRGWPRGPTDTSVLYLLDTALSWVEAGALDILRAQALVKTYHDVDAVYVAAVGNRTTEYARAEEAARAFLAADPKPTPVSDYITGHALNNPTGLLQSEAWAAQQIVERADAFKWAELQMRNVRFARQADMRAAATHDELCAAVTEWEGFIAWMRNILGL